MFRYYNGKIPDIFQNIFMMNSDIHDHYTRQSGSYHVPKVKNNLGKWSIRYRGVIVWNTILSLKINPETSEAMFAKAVKKCVINQSFLYDCFTYVDKSSDFSPFIERTLW